MGLFWDRPAAGGAAQFQWLRFLGIGVIFGALVVAGIWAESAGREGGAAFLYGCAGGAFTVWIGFLTVETFRR
jgi:hypothetical protein